jgi:hypothetical protein
MGGGKQTTTSAVQIPEWLEAAAQRNLAKADTLSQIGYTPYYGPDVAAMTPMQLAAMQGTNTAASAFGMPTADPTAGMPAAQNYGGMQAYSSGSLYDQALAELQSRQPGQYAALRAPFIDPVTGAQPMAPYGYGPGGGGGGSSSGGSAAPGPAPMPMREGGGGDGRIPVSTGQSLYTGLRDMIDGGGPGRSGTTFSGGLLSGGLNRIGVSPAKAAPAKSAPSKSAPAKSTSGSKSSGSKSSGGGSNRGGSSGRR